MHARQHLAVLLRSPSRPMCRNPLRLIASPPVSSSLLKKE